MKNLYFTIVALLLSLASYATGPIIGNPNLCVGATNYLSDATPGGIWSSSNYSIANISGSTIGMVTGVSAGIATITYTASGVSSIMTVTVSANPSPITGAASVCPGSGITLNDATAGGIWSESNTTVASVIPSTGVVTGVISGTDTIYYILPAGCSSKTLITVGPPASGTITGLSSVCVGNNITLSDGVLPAGVWGSTNANATVSSGGVVTGATAGTDTINYTIASSCGTAIAIHPITITNTSAGTITGPISVCPGSTIYLSDPVPGGYWSGSSGSLTVGSYFGSVTGASVGTGTVTYTLTGCTGTIYATTTITVTANPTAITIPSNVCPGSTITLSDATTGGTWSNSTTTIATVAPATGTVTGVATGTSSITYTLATGCSAYANVTVGAPTSGYIYGPTAVCGGYTINLSDNIMGGVWSCTNANATVSGSGVVTGVTVGIDTVDYAMTTTCGTAIATHTVTVSASAGTITGPSSVCAGSQITLTDLTAGGTWTSSNATIAQTGSASGGIGTINGIGAGTATITYSISGCGGTLYATTSLTVNALPAVTASLSLASCGGIYTFSVTGSATTYSWSPTTGLSCSTCSITTCVPAASGSYMVTGTNAAGCAKTANVSVNGNEISGYITFTGASTDSFKAWLINYDPVDSQIVSIDSVISCSSGGAPYYQFSNPPSGSYMVKAELFGTVPGTSGYIPTYSLSSPHWNTATTISHVSSHDTMHINMIYGTVPSGAGFISGNVYSGAGRGTSTDIPAVDMLIYLEDASGNVLTYTYTDTGGAYAFNSLAYDNYIIYPEAYSYYTTESAIITLNATTSSAAGVDFKQHTTYGTITPYSSTGIAQLSGNGALNIFPNPANNNLTIQWKNQATGNADLVISDMVGREVLKTTVNINASGQSQLNIASLDEGVYLITIKSDNAYFTSKLLIEK